MLAGRQSFEVIPYGPLTAWPMASLGDEGRPGITGVQRDDLEQLVDLCCLLDMWGRAATGGTPASEYQQGVCAKGLNENQKTKRARCVCACGSRVQHVSIWVCVHVWVCENVSE